MSMYFNVSRNSKDLKLALSAYDKAVDNDDFLY